MRIEIAGAQITESVVDVIETLQVEREIRRQYVETLDYLTRYIIMDINGDDEEDAATLGRLRVLQMLRRDINILADPPEADLPENDIPTASF